MIDVGVKLLQVPAEVVVVVVVHFEANIALSSYNLRVG